MSKARILVADDEARMRRLVCDYLVRADYEVVQAGDGEEALKAYFSGQEPDLVILDVMMPKADGWEVLRTIRENARTPVIMLTARAAESDELTGFDLGADDYVTKPFSPRLLVARVEALLRRHRGASGDILEAAGIAIDRSAHTVKAAGEDVFLSVKEFELLAFFMENPGIALSRETILNHVWNYDYVGDARTIDTHVKKLRSKLGPCGDTIRTVWGMGYKFDPASGEGVS